MNSSTGEVGKTVSKTRIDIPSKAGSWRPYGTCCLTFASLRQKLNCKESAP